MKYVILLLGCLLILGCDLKNDVYFNEGTTITFHKHKSDSKHAECDISPHDDYDIFQCSYTNKDKNNIIIYLTLDNDTYEEKCQKKNKILVCDNLGTFEKNKG